VGGGFSFLKSEFYYLCFWGEFAAFQVLFGIARRLSRGKQLCAFELLLDFGPVNLRVRLVFVGVVLFFF